MKKCIDLYPLTIIRDPYDGKFSGGKYIAINESVNSISPYIDESEDVCKAWWEQKSKEYLIGIGNTAEEAQEDLYQKLMPKDEGEKYLFLDFDGVLNTGNYQKRMKKEGIDANDEYGPMFDPQTVEYLKQIIDRTGCKVVISSTWRDEGIERMMQMWKDRAMPGEIYSMTPILLSTTFQDAINGELLSAPPKLAKALEIDMWLQKHASKEARYVILDDEKILVGEDYYDHLIEVNDQEGIGVYEVQRACWMLNDRPKKMTGEY